MRRVVSGEPVVDDVGVRHVAIYLVDPEDGDRIMASVNLSFTPDPEQPPLAHGLEAREWAEKGDVARLVQGVRGTLNKMGYKEIMIHSHEDPKNEEQWFIKAGAKHDVSFYRLSTGRS